MKYTLLFLLLPAIAVAQESSPLFTKVLQFDSISKADIYDKSLIWCSRSFKDSKSAINVKEKESGIISGKAFLQSNYRMPRKKKDSTIGVVYNDYYFSWLIEIKDNKLRFTVQDVTCKMDEYHTFPVVIGSKRPIKLMFYSEETSQQEWDLANHYFLAHMDAIAGSLHSEVSKKGVEW